MPFKSSGAFLTLVVGTVIAALVAACASSPLPRNTRADKTKKGAGYGAAAGAAAALLLGKDKAEEILAGAAVGAAAGAGVGLYMDRQEEKLTRIPGTSVERVDRRTLLVHFDSDVLFDVDSASLSPAARGNLGRLAGVLAEFPKTAVVVQGHTDSTGSEAHNMSLSERRAAAVRAELVALGVDPGRIAAVGYGEDYPVASNATAGGRQLNRRVDLMLRAKAT